MKYKGIVISDIHVGAMDLHRTRTEFTEVFIKHISKMKKLDFVIVAGDFFDKKFYLGDKESIVAHAMLKELVDICDEKNAKLRFVYGTESHEADQYSVMNVLHLSSNIKVIKYVEEEELLPGLNILYLPEEHIYDKEEYYKDYFKNKKKYDYIFGHGVIKEVWQERAVMLENKSESKRKKVPLFSSGELINCCKGQVYFGHFHINRNNDDKVFSIGSFSRWCFGEDGDKGFYELSVDTEKEKYDFKHIINNMAESYTTISYGYKDIIYDNQDNMNEALNHIDKLLKDDVFDHVRFVFNIPDDAENPEATINYLKERYKTNDKVKLDITHGYIETKRELQKQKIQEDNDKYYFITDESLPLEDKVSHFITITYDKDISVEDTSLCLYKPLQEIIDITM